MEKGLVSIIVPVYKVEAWLGRCLQSLVFQTYKQIEIILVDDGSPDACPDICDSWKRRDRRIKVIHKENGGLSSARNEGLRSAQGEYIAFVDSDDWISLGMIEKMMAAMQEYDADMVNCQFLNVYPNGYCRKNWDCSDGIRVCSVEETVRLLLQDGEITNHVWRRLYKRECLWEEPFPEGKKFEDIFVSYKLMMQCRRIVIMDEAFYYYFKNDNGIVVNISAESLKDRYEAFRSREKELMKRYPELADEIRTSRLKDDYYLWEDANYAMWNTEASRKEVRRVNALLRQDIRGNKSVLRKCPRKIAFFCFLIAYIPFSVSAKKVCSKVYRLLKGWREREVREFFRKINRSGPCFYVLATPDYGNLGDWALRKAEEKFVEEYFPGYRFVGVPHSKLGIYGRIYLRTHVRNKDIVCVHAGGNIGTLYPGLHKIQERAIAAMGHRKLTIFPQTMYYSRTEEGCAVLEETKKVYQKCKDLEITVREKTSFSFAQANFSVKSHVFPDMVLFLQPYKSSAVRNGALLCLRSDSEQTLTEEDHLYLLETVAGMFSVIDQTDTHVGWNPDEQQMEHEMKKCLDKFAVAQLVVTDRLHGMVFAALTGTSCVVLPSQSHKTEGVYQWIRHLDNIAFLEDMKGLERAIQTVCAIRETGHHGENLKPYWDEMASVIGR